MVVRAFIAFVTAIQGRPWAAPVFMSAYALACLGLPTTPFPVAAGSLFGFWPGFLLSDFCLTAGCSLGFFIARRWGTRFIHRFLGKRSEQALAKRPGFFLMVVVRLTGIPPLPLANYLAGLSEMPYSKFVGATALGYVPWCLVTNYFSSVLWKALVEGGLSGIERVIVAKAGPLLAALAAFAALIAGAAWLNRKLHSEHHEGS